MQLRVSTRGLLYMHCEISGNCDARVGRIVYARRELVTLGYYICFLYITQKTTPPSLKRIKPIFNTSSRVKRIDQIRFIPLTEPHVRTSYTAPV